MVGAQSLIRGGLCLSFAETSASRSSRRPARSRSSPWRSSAEIAERHTERPAELVEPRADLLRGLAHGLEEDRVVADGGAQMRMLVAGCAGELEEDFQM